jgi:CheY-like chemotaxis protein
VADGAQLEQVFLNLIINASQVMPEGGVLCIQTRLEGAGGTELVARVGDTGPGIRPEDLPRIFEPFYSVRPLGVNVPRGTGLGLSVAHGIVSAHGGSIRCTSELGRGATFELRLGVADGPAAEAAGAAAIEPAQVSGKSVLVADDEGDILDVVDWVLKEQGFRVIGVSDTAQALEELDRGGYDLVISDLIMPGGGGREIVARAARMQNPIPVIIITGMPEEAVRRDIAGGKHVTVVLKPFGLNQVMDAVNRALASS